MNTKEVIHHEDTKNTKSEGLVRTKLDRPYRAWRVGVPVTQGAARWRSLCPGLA